MKTFSHPMVLILLFICCSVFKTALARPIENQCQHTHGLVSNKVKCICCNHDAREAGICDASHPPGCEGGSCYNTCDDTSGFFCTANPGQDASCSAIMCTFEDGETENEETCQCGPESGTGNKYVCDAETKGRVCKYTSSGSTSSYACGCPAGRYQDSALCATCPANYVSQAMATECIDIRTNIGCPAGKHQAYEACKQCPTGYYQKDTGGKYCLFCPNGYRESADRQSCVIGGCEAGTYQEEGGGCAICHSGQYRTGNQGDTCTRCPTGFFLSDKQRSEDKHDSPDDCFECAEGTFSLPGAEFCRQCPAGWYKDDNDSQMIDCAQCEAGFYAKKAAAQTCTGCDNGRYQSEPRQSFCLPCGAGLYADQVNSVSCKQCRQGTFRGVTSANNLDPDVGSTCDDCPLGLYSTAQGTADCFPCAPGLYADQEGLKTCKNCAAKTFASGFRATECGRCPLGWDTKDQDGASECVACSKGTYGSELGTCSNCPRGQYTDAKELTSCKLPSLGKVVNKAQTSEVRPPYKSAADCSNSQYLDDITSRDRDEWKCADCPEGGDCSGFSVWSNIKPLNGYWRTLAKSKKKRPDCANELKCPVFIKCVSKMFAPPLQFL